MNGIASLKVFLISIGLLFAVNSAFADELKPVKLLKPQVEKGKPLMQVLTDKNSSRSFSTEKLPLQELSNLLWAAFGVNRSDTGKRTAPSAVNWQEIDIYVATADGLYLAKVMKLRSDQKIILAQSVGYPKK